MNDKISFSIIIPVYNSRLKFLLSALQSIEIQSYNNYEVLIVNDGSDNRIDYQSKLNNYLQNKKYRYIISEKNLGQGHARNLGMKFANNDIILYLDSDDLLDQNALTTLSSIFEKHQNIDFVRFQYRNIDFLLHEQIDTTKYNVLINRENAIQNLDYLNGFGSNILCRNAYRKKFLLKNNIFFLDEKIFYEDTYYDLLIKNNFKNCLSISDILYFYRRNNHLSTTTSASSTSEILAINYCITKIFYQIENKDILFYNLLATHSDYIIYNEDQNLVNNLQKNLPKFFDKEKSWKEVIKLKLYKNRFIWHVARLSYFLLTFKFIKKIKNHLFQTAELS